jgi:hypothetical protein
MLVCTLFCTTAHEIAGAARTRSSLRPLDWRAGSFWQSSGATRREIAQPYSAVIVCNKREAFAHASGAKQSIAQRKEWIASLRSQ